MKRLILVLISLLVLSSFAMAEGQQEQTAESWPSKSVSVIVPYSAGGGTDRMARTITPYLEKELGESVVVVNRPGAAGEIGMQAIADADPDGYTLGLLGFPDNYSMAAYKDVSFDNDKFNYIASFTETPTILVAGPNSPYDSLEEFIEYAKANPGRVTISESGDSHTITAVLLEEAADATVTTVNYDGAGENFNAILGGHVDAGVLALLFADNAIDQGCKILAVASNQREEKYPDVPTFREKGYNVMVISSRVLTVPTGTPDAIIQKLTQAVNEVGKSEELKQSIKKGGEVYRFRSGDELQEFIAETRDTVTRIGTKYREKFVR